MTLINTVNEKNQDGGISSEQPQRNSTSKLFNDLLESSKSLPTTSSDLGSIQLSIQEINRRARELRSHPTASTTHNGSAIKQEHREDHTKAHYLLAGSGLQFDEVDTSLKVLEQNQILSNSTLNKNAPSIATNSGVTSNLSTEPVGTNIRLASLDLASSSYSTDNKVEFTEIDNYLKIKKNENILASIEMLLSNAAKDFDDYVNDNLNLNWNERKNIIKQNFGILVSKKSNQANSLKSSEKAKILNNDDLMKFWSKKSTGNRLDGIDLLNDSYSNDSFSKLNVNEHYMLRDKFEKNAKIIHRFNNARQQNTKFPLNQEFMSLLSTNSNDLKSRKLLESWKIVESFQEVKNKMSTSLSNPNSSTFSRNNLVITNARKYLQGQFKEYVDLLYNKEMDEGLPTNTNKIKSFIEKKLKNSASGVTSTNIDNLTLRNTTTNASASSGDVWKISNLTIVNGTPIWALIFYLLRAGMEKEALDVMINNRSCFKKIEQSFITYFKAYIHAKSNGDGELPVEFMTRLHNEYNQHIKNSLNGDPYRLAVYKIIGRCDLTKKSIPEITLNIEDWLWIHFMLIKEESINDTELSNKNVVNDTIYKNYTLEEFQQLILSYGVQKFNNDYLQILLLCGLFEYAVEYAYKISELDAVHLAIGICNQQLLNVSKDPLSSSLIVHDNEQNLTNNKNNISINFVKIITSYIRSFKYSDPRIALEYLLLIGLNSKGGKNDLQTSFMHECIRELILQTKEFTILLGKIGRDGTRIPGVIEQRRPLLLIDDEMDNKSYLKVITEQAALKADEDGRVYDSLLLYQLAEEYDIVISIINNIISNLLSDSDLTCNILVNINDNSETNPILLAEKLIDIHLNRQDNNNSTISLKNRETCLLLLKIVEIRKLFDSNNAFNVTPNDRNEVSHINVVQWEEILNKIIGLNILPLVVNQNSLYNNNMDNNDNTNGDFSGGEEIGIRKKAEEFNLMNPNIVKCIPNLLVITMISVNKIIQRLKSSLSQSKIQSNTTLSGSNPINATNLDNSKMDQINAMKKLARNCMIYAGMIQYKMPRETYSTLIQIDIAL